MIKPEIKQLQLQVPFEMPELPEVQTIVNDLHAAGFVGSTIVRAKVFWPRTIANASAARFCHILRGQTIATILRRGKFILFRLQAGRILGVHLRMTGRFQIRAQNTPRDRHVHVLLRFADGRELHFHDTRKFGRFFLVEQADELVGGLGPEPLHQRFTAKRLAERLAGERRALKPLLLDQTFLAGLGNIYVDEALWAARLHPLQPANTLSAPQVKALHRAIRSVLRQGLKNAGTTLGRGQNNFHSVGEKRGQNSVHLKVFRRTGAPCPRCRRPILRLMVGQRSTHICGRCQRIRVEKISGDDQKAAEVAQHLFKAG